MKISTALISVFDKAGVVDFARALAERGVKILSTGGTARTLQEAGVALTEVSEHTGSPEIMNGRVKTLHPRIHGGILAVRENRDHCRQAEEQGITLIDLVAVNLYPFREVIAKPSVTLEEAIENIDIGGPAMVRSAAKNHRYVTVVTDPADYDRALQEMAEHDGATGDNFRRELAVKAYAHTSEYDQAITSYLGGDDLFPQRLALPYQKVQELRYGENPHQQGAFYRKKGAAGASVATARRHGGKELSYNNLLDLDSAFELVRVFEQTACVVVKHNNPCGAAEAETQLDAFVRAREGDPVSAYGGIVAFNRTLDLPTAETMATKENFFEAIVAPAYGEGVIDSLRSGSRWGTKVRILEATGDLPGAAAPHQIRGIRNGLLVQTADDRMVEEWKEVVGQADESLKEDLIFAMTVCAHVRSNAIVLAKNRRVTGVGAGQMSRLDSAEIAVRKAGARVQGSVAASDAFFPFPDALEILARAGVKAVVHPGGSIRDDKVAAAAKKAGVGLFTTGVRHFRH